MHVARVRPRSATASAHAGLSLTDSFADYVIRRPWSISFGGPPGPGHPSARHDPMKTTKGRWPMTFNSPYKTAGQPVFIPDSSHNAPHSNDATVAVLSERGQDVS